jgi:hypothetical protein
VDTLVATGTTRTITVPNANITLDDSGDTRDPNAHSSSHFTGGSDQLQAHQIHGQTIYSVQSLVITTSAQQNRTAARAKIFNVVQFAGTAVDVKRPSTGALEGDTFVFRWGTGSDSINIRNG